MQIEQAREFILGKLNKELPEHFYYHNAAHATDVYNAARLIAKNEGVGEYETKLLLTAALFHDSGFLFNGKTDHELRSCEIVRLHLPGFDYTSDDIEQICDTIMATKLPQDPHNHLGEVICDADLDYLGRNDFFVLSKKLFSELVITDGLKTEGEWNKIQIAFFRSHHYFTKTAIELRSSLKQEHLEEITKKEF